MEIYLSKSLNDTESIAKKIAESCNGGEIILLNGDLGAGKTTFTKFFAKHLGVTENVTSPTFTLMKSYSSGRLPLYHFDLYRVASEEEISELGFYEYFDTNGIFIIEWNKLEKLTGKLIHINIEYVDETSRKFNIF